MDKSTCTCTKYGGLTCKCQHSTPWLTCLQYLVSGCAGVHSLIPGLCGADGETCEGDGEPGWGGYHCRPLPPHNWERVRRSGLAAKLSRWAHSYKYIWWSCCENWAKKSTWKWVECSCTTTYQFEPHFVVKETKKLLLKAKPSSNVQVKSFYRSCQVCERGRRTQNGCCCCTLGGAGVYD